MSWPPVGGCGQLHGVGGSRVHDPATGVERPLCTVFPPSCQVEKRKMADCSSLSTAPSRPNSSSIGPHRSPIADLCRDHSHSISQYRRVESPVVEQGCDRASKAHSAASIPLFIAVCVPLILATFMKPAVQPMSAPPGKASCGMLCRPPSFSALAPYATLCPPSSSLLTWGWCFHNCATLSKRQRERGRGANLEFLVRVDIWVLVV